MPDDPAPEPVAGGEPAPATSPSAPAPNGRWRAPADVVDDLLGDTAVLARPRERASVALNRTAYAVWLALSDPNQPDGARVSDAVHELAAAFGQAPDAIADQVAAVVMELASSGWLIPADVSAPTPQHDSGCARDDPRGAVPVPHADHWHLPLPASPCQAGVDGRPWVRTIAVRVGRFHVGIRVDAEATGVIVERLLAAHVVLDPDTPPAWSIVLGPASRAFPRKGLYEGHTFVTGTEAPGPIVAALIGRLSGLIPAPAGCLRLAAGAAIPVAGDEAPSPGRDPRLVELRPQPRGVTITDTQPAPVLVRPAPRPGDLPELTGEWPGLTVDPDLAGRIGVPAPARGPIGSIAGISELETPAARAAALVRLLHLAPDDDPTAAFALVTRLAAS